MTVGVWILGDQLWTEQAALLSCKQKEGLPVIFIESLDWVRVRPYHKQKLVLVWSAMRHFAEELRDIGYSVSYEIAEDFITPLQAWVKENQITELRVMEPTDKPFLQIIQDLNLQDLNLQDLNLQDLNLQDLNLPCKVTIIPNNHFLWSKEEFQNWAQGRKRLLMEDFYREGRRRFQILMEDNKPIGGKWNLDKENRKPPKGKLNTPPAKWFEPDEITQKVIEHLHKLCGNAKFDKQCRDVKFYVSTKTDNSEDCRDVACYVSTYGEPCRVSTYGEVENFGWGVTRTDALQVLDWFLENRLAGFGPYQDAMVTGEDTMWHAMLSPYLNLGLLQPLEVIQAAEKAYHQNQLPLNSVEGFIRQILGWREYMHGIYHHTCADYPEKNWFNHTQPLPEFFWNGETKMNCLHQILTQVQRTGYAHHIQRLMVLSNFSLIAGFSPQEVENWFHAAFIDAYDWVMQTNVIGMGLFADGGILASKPYASSANYVNKMSDYCKSCFYNHKERTGEKACPFNFFYWDFLQRHRDKLQTQGRMSFILKNLDKMSAEELQAIQKQVENWRFSLTNH